MGPILRRIGLALAGIICAVVLLVLALPQEPTKLGTERPDCYYLIGDGAVTATTVPGCPTRPPGNPGPSLTP
jgi:hypothetical protein